MDPTAPRTPSAALAALAAGFNRFGWQLYRELPSDGNAFFSPISLATALAALLPGARDETAREIADILGVRGATGDAFDPSMRELLAGLEPRAVEDRDWSAGEARLVQRETFRLSLATALFVEDSYPLQPDYYQLLADVFRAGFFSVRFADAAATADRINSWVSDRTAGRIPRLISSGDLAPDSRLVLANAVYFKAPWATQFHERATQLRAFHLLPGGKRRTVEVPMMSRLGYHAYWSNESADLQALRIPYESGLSMLVLLPALEHFTDWESRLSHNLVSEIVAGAATEYVDLKLPRFELRSSFQLGGALKALGARRAFDVGADFSGITPHREGLVLAEVLHQAWVQVDEKGTEAAAATAMIMLRSTGFEEKPAPIPFILDRPFLFLIHDDHTGVVLFLGRVVDPR